jgi:hypothetical protein
MLLSDPNLRFLHWRTISGQFLEMIQIGALQKADYIPSEFLVEF